MVETIHELIGFVELGEKHRPYSFKNWVLTIYFDEELDFLKTFSEDLSGISFLNMSPKKLPSMELDAIDSANNQIVKFGLYDGFLNPSYKRPGPCSVQLRVKYFTFISFNPKPDDKTKISIWSNELSEFLSVKPIYKVDIIDKKMEGTVTCNSPTLSEIASGTIDGIDIRVRPSFSISNRIHEFDFVSGLLIQLEKSIDNGQIFQFAQDVISSISFLFARNNVKVDYISYSNRIENGKMYINRILDFEREKASNSQDDLSIHWSLIYPHYVELLKLIHTKQIYINHLQDSRSFRYFVSDISISKDSAAFESEFRYVFQSDDVPYSEESKMVEDAVSRELDEAINNCAGKKRRIYLGFKKHIHQNSLFDKISFCLGQYKTCLSSMMKQFSDGHTFEDVAETCSGVRNIVDHGKERSHAPMGEAEAFVILRGLIYAMQMRRIGMKDSEIEQALSYLYRI